MFGSSSLRVLFVLALGLTEIGTSSAAPGSSTKRGTSLEERELTTNAARFAQGLPPLAPRNMFDPTKPKPAENPQPSVVPISGKIKVKSLKNEFIGYISKIYHDAQQTPDKTNAKHRFTTTKQAANSLLVTFAPTKVQAFDIRILKPLNNLLPYLGFTGKTLDNETKSHRLVRTKHTAPGSKPKKVGNSYDNGYSESSIWKYDATTKNITAHWVNPDGSKPTTYLFYDRDDKSVTIVANPVTAKKTHPNAIPVSLIFEP